MQRFILCLISIVVSSTVFSQTKVACIGNSVTYGYGIENRATNSYPTQLQQLLGSEYEVQNFGGLTLPFTFSDHMVLQRDMPLTLSGTANKGSKVSIEIAGKKAQTVTPDNGKWTLTLPPLKAGGPYTLQVKADNETKSFKDVLIGEVWLCSGQSNMAWMLKQSKGGKETIEQADNPNIRLLNMQPRWQTYDIEWPKATMDSLNNLQYYRNNGWQETTPATAADFSAIAYYFGQMLQDSLQVPVGLILNAVGGSNTESWIDRKSLEYNHELVDILKDWTQNDMIQQWCRERGAKNIKQSEYKEQRHPYQPCYLFEAGILPLQKYPVRGVLWYQGESNAHNIEIHEALFTQLVDSWRTNWNENLPFYFVQLSSLNRPSWPRFRDSQRKLSHTVPNTYMVVSSDKGDSLDVHPTDKQPIGQRLALQALKNSYGRNQLVAFGPEPSRVAYKANEVEITFNNAASLQPTDGNTLIGFEIAGNDGVYHPASAQAKGNKVLLKSKEVKQPVSVRYGWQPFTRANLVNEVALPASTFINQK